MSVQELAGGRYRTEEVLGRGGMASVYLARDGEPDRPVAVKVLAEHLADTPGFGSASSGRRSAAQLSHPASCRCSTWAREQGRPSSWNASRDRRLRTR